MAKRQDGNDQGAADKAGATAVSDGTAQGKRDTDKAGASAAGDGAAQDTRSGKPDDFIDRPNPAPPIDASHVPGEYPGIGPKAVREFLGACTQLDPKGSVSLEVLHEAWRRFASRVPTHPMTPAWLGRHLEGDERFTLEHGPGTFPVVRGLVLKPGVI